LHVAVEIAPPPHILIHIAEQLNVPLKSLVATITLLDEGGTAPFIARYRKEATGNLDELGIGAIAERLQYFRELEKRRETVPATIRGARQANPRAQGED
jgi:protein Tex